MVFLKYTLSCDPAHFKLTRKSRTAASPHRIQPFFFTFKNLTLYSSENCFPLNPQCHCNIPQFSFIVNEFFVSFAQYQDKFFPIPLYAYFSSHVDTLTLFLYTKSSIEDIQAPNAQVSPRNFAPRKDIPYETLSGYSGHDGPFP